MEISLNQSHGVFSLETLFLWCLALLLLWLSSCWCLTTIWMLSTIKLALFWTTINVLFLIMLETLSFVGFVKPDDNLCHLSFQRISTLLPSEGFLLIQEPMVMTDWIIFLALPHYLVVIALCLLSMRMMNKLISLMLPVCLLELSKSIPNLLFMMASVKVQFIQVQLSSWKCDTFSFYLVSYFHYACNYCTYIYVGMWWVWFCSLWKKKMSRILNCQTSPHFTKVK